MASISDKITTPQYQAFQPNALEQVYASELPHMGGLAAMFLNAAQDERKQGSAAYQSGVTQANRLAMALDQMEEAQKYKTEELKGNVELAKVGYHPGGMTRGTDLFTNIPQANADAQTFDNLRIAEAGAANAKASEGAGTKTEMIGDEYPGMPNGGPVRVKVTGRDANMVAAEQARQGAIARARLNAPGSAAPIPPSTQMMRDRLDSLNRQ